jgi:hypothetical protein
MDKCRRLPGFHRYLLTLDNIGLRHSCEIGDDMASYGWSEYDGRLGGKQVLSDRGMKIDIETEFIKIPGPNGMYIW